MGCARDTLGVEWLGVTIRCHSDHLEMSENGSLGPHVLRGGTQTAHAHVGTGATLLCVCVEVKVREPLPSSMEFQRSPCRAFYPSPYISFRELSLGKGVCKQMSWRR